MWANLSLNDLLGRDRTLTVTVDDVNDSALFKETIQSAQRTEQDEPMHVYLRHCLLARRPGLVFGAAILLTSWACTSEGPPPSQLLATAPTATATDEPWTRVVWTRDLGDGTDYISRGNQLVLMAYDSHDGRGERMLLETVAGYAKPLITPSGGDVIFSDRAKKTVYAVRWDGSDRRRIANGFGLAVWADPETGDEWVYVGRRPKGGSNPSYRRVYRYRLDDRKRELVWDAQPVTGNGFQLSADGRYAGGLFPWPHAGVADLTAGTWRVLGEGCWTALAPDGKNLFWYFDGSHRNLTFVDIDTDERWQVPINGAPGINGFEVYHPRWTNHSRYLVTTGPYTVGRRDNKIRSGGHQVEVWLGRFSADFSNVQHWRQITDNDYPDFYPDAWVDPTHTPPDEESTSTITRAVSDATASARLVVDVRVRQHSPVPTPQSIAPYKHGLQALEYDVIEVIEGVYGESTLVVAHWVIRDGAVLESAARPAAWTDRLTVERYDTHPELEGQRLVMDSNAFTLPLYYDLDTMP